MRIMICGSFGGIEHVPTIEQRLACVKAAGFDAVEAAAPQMAPEDWKTHLGKQGLSYIGTIAAQDAQSFRRQLDHIRAYDPILVVAASGRDFMKFREGCEFFLAALAAERELGVPVAHETRRQTLFYAPWATLPYLEEFPDLKLCADFSHWCVVCESMMDALSDIVALACERAVHIHARVGYEQGPQVSDPRAPEYEPYVQRHEKWWDLVYESRKGSGADRLTVTPRFKPPPYQQALPYTRQPVVDLWDISCWMARRLRARWAC